MDESDTKQPVMTKKHFLFSLVYFFTGITVWGQMSLSHYFSDNMVLQHGRVNNIYGGAPAGAAVTIKYQNKKLVVRANSKGEWNFPLPASKPGKAGKITFSSGEEEIVLENWLFGDVWVCSGQSNMEFQMSSFKDVYGDEMQKANNNNIRFMVVEKRFDNKEWRSPPIGRSWRPITPASIPECSAVAYFFAKKLQQQLNIPIGLVISAWGGTPAQSWMDTLSLKPFSNYDRIYHQSIKKIDLSQLSEIRRKATEVFNQKRISSAPFNTGMARVEYDDASWENTSLPGVWEDKGYPDLDGIAIYRTRFSLPAGVENQEAELYLPAVDDVDSTYINGVFVGSLGIWNQPRIYKVPANILKQGENVLTVWVEDGQGGGGMSNDPNRYYIKVGDRMFNLSAPAKFKILASTENVTPGVNLSSMQYQPGVLYNTMIAPLLKTSIKGVIWYQGESNVPQYEEYRNLFPALINGWRKKWKQGNFPFLFVQLSSYNPGGKEPVLSNWAFLREAQTAALKLPHTGMAVTTDVGDRDDIHPKRKKEVGERLAANAFYGVYGIKGKEYIGPVYQSQSIKGNAIEISFSHIGSGLRNTPTRLMGFAIAGEDKKFQPAAAEIRGGKVVVKNNDVPAPKYVRYAWGNAPLEANLYNQDGFPAAPFRTDK
jgi:sialate O-acetylesterase